MGTNGTTGTTWGPRWYTTDPPGGDTGTPSGVRGVRRVVRVDGTAAQPGGTWPHLAYLADLAKRANIPPGGIRLRASTIPLRGIDSRGLTEAELREFVRLRDRRRVEARLATLRRGQRVSRVDHAARAAEVRATGHDVREYRERRGLSQRDFAQLLGFSRGLLSEVEKGRRTGFEIRAWVQRELQAAR